MKKKKNRKQKIKNRQKTIRKIATLKRVNKRKIKKQKENRLKNMKKISEN